MTRLRTLARPPLGDGHHHGLGVGQAGCALGVAHVRSPALGLAGLTGGGTPQEPRSGPCGLMCVLALGERTQRSSQVPCAPTEPGHRCGQQAAQGNRGNA